MPIHLKRKLGQFQPTAKPSHIVGAIARAFGRATNAALRADTSGLGQSNALLARFDGVAFCRRLSDLGPAEHLDTPDQLVAMSKLPDPCWTEFSKHDLAANNAWYFVCRDENLPNPCIRKRRKYAELAWDCVSLDPRFGHATHGKGGSVLARRMLETFQARACGRPGKPIFFGSAFVGTIDPVEPEIARDSRTIIFSFCMKLRAK